MEPIALPAFTEKALPKKVEFLDLLERESTTEAVRAAGLALARVINDAKLSEVEEASIFETSCKLVGEFESTQALWSKLSSEMEVIHVPPYASCHKVGLLVGWGAVFMLMTVAIKDCYESSPSGPLEIVGFVVGLGVMIYAHGKVKQAAQLTNAMECFFHAVEAAQQQTEDQTVGLLTV